MSSFIRGESSHDWSDVTPVPQDDGPAPVAAIAYSAQYKELMDYFRAMVANEEYSERSLALTEEILEHNAANYTVWHFRRNALKALQKNVDAELDFMDEFASENPKNYQIWHHRREMAKGSADGKRELEFTEGIFAEDPKNYHAWAHRQWALRHFNDIWDGEMDYVQGLLLDDVRNNSAWNQRWYVLHNRSNSSSSSSAGAMHVIDNDALAQEVSFVFETIQKTGVKNNESAWNYLRGLALEHPVIQAAVLVKLRTFLGEEEGCNSGNVYAIGLLADMLVAAGSPSTVREASGHFTLLSTLDPIRAKFWLRRTSEAEALLLK